MTWPGGSPEAGSTRVHAGPQLTCALVLAAHLPAASALSSWRPLGQPPRFSLSAEYHHGLWEGDRGDCVHLHGAPAQVRHRQHSGLDVESRLHHSLQKYPFSCHSKCPGLPSAPGAAASTSTLLAGQLCVTSQLGVGVRGLRGLWVERIPVVSAPGSFLQGSGLGAA